MVCSALTAANSLVCCARRCACINNDLTNKDRTLIWTGEVSTFSLWKPLHVIAFGCSLQCQGVRQPQGVQERDSFTPK